MFLPIILCSKKEKGKQKKKRKSFKAENIKRLSPRSKCYCFSPSRASRIQKLFLPANHGGLFNVPWPLYFEIHFAGPAWIPNYGQIYLKNAFHDKMTFLDYWCVYSQNSFDKWSIILNNGNSLSHYT